MEKTNLYGHALIHEENDHYGYDYLAHKINHDEAEVLFHYAKTHGSAQFETQTGKNYSLVHNHDGTYTIVKR